MSLSAFQRRESEKKKKRDANLAYRAKKKEEKEEQKKLKLRINGKLVNVPVNADNVTEVTVVVPSPGPQVSQEKLPNLTPDNNFLKKKQRSSVYNQNQR